MVVVLDDSNPSVLIDSITFDIYVGNSSDSEVANYLNNIHPDHIVVMSIYDTVVVPAGACCTTDIPRTLSVIGSWGCRNVSSIGFRNSFIFIGKAITNDIPSWAYCKLGNNDTAIFKSIQLSISTYASTELPNSNPTNGPTIHPSLPETMHPSIHPSESPTDNNGRFDTSINCSKPATGKEATIKEWDLPVFVEVIITAIIVIICICIGGIVL